MTKPNSTEIIVVLDRSGSMQAIKKDMEGGFTSFIEEQKKVPGECRLTLTQFDDQYETVYTALPLASVPALVLEPRGMTALLDALGRTINDVGARLASTPERERPSQVIFVVITDGQENASREYNQRRIFDMIQHQRDKYSWEFVFLGANQDAIATASAIGIAASNSVTFDANSVGSQAVYSVVSRGLTNYRISGQQTMDNVCNQAMYNAAVKQSLDASLNIDPDDGSTPAATP